MAELFVSTHAIERYRERVADVPPIEVCRRLNAPVFRKAAAFGAPYVRLAGGQRVVVANWSIVTVLPRDHAPGRLDPARDHRFDDGDAG